MNENYIAELMARMEESSTMRDAFREAEALNDVGLLSQLEPLVQQARKSNEIQGLSKILAGLARNTQHPQIAVLYGRLLEKPKLTGEAVMYLIERAHHAGLNQFGAWVRKQLTHKSSTVLSAAIQYLGQSGAPDDLKAVGELLDRDCDGRCHPMYCIFAFEENSRREGIPYIERAIQRHAHGRKKIDQEICGYGEIALAKFAGRPVTYHGDGTVTWSTAADENKQE